MPTLTEEEIAVLSEAGFDEHAIAQLDALAAATPWLEHARWHSRHQFWLSLSPFPVIVLGAAFLDQQFGLYVLLLTATLLPLLSLPLRRLLTSIREPQASSARTAIALAVRAEPEDGGGRGAAFFELKRLAETVESGDVVDALTAHAFDQRRSRLRLLGVAAAMTGVLGAIFMVGAAIG
jgi:hypothetical protein